MSESARNDLRMLSQAFATGDDAPDAVGCPPAERLFDAVHGRLDPRALRDVVDHVAACGACTEAWRLARELRELASEPAAVAPAVRRVRDWSRWVAAAALVLLAGGALWQSARPPQPPILRGAQGEAPQMVSSERLPRHAFELVWEVVPDATAYEVEILHQFAEVLAPTRTPEPRLQVSPEVLEGLPAGARLEGLVTPIFADGSRGKTRPFTVELEDSAAPAVPGH